MSAQVSLFLRSDRVIAIPQGGGGGFSYDIEPSHVVAADPREVEAALLQAIDSSRQAQGGTPPPRVRASAAPVLRKLGVKSFKEFYSGATHCYVYEEDGALWILRFIPARDRAGFDLAPSPPERIPDLKCIGEIVFECLQSSQRMPLLNARRDA